MDLGELRPGDRQHLGRGVELHRAGAERNHGAIKREVAIREATHVAGHLAFRPVHVKDRMGQIRGLANERRGQAIFRMFVAIDEVVAAEGAPHGFQRRRPRALVDRDPDTIVADLAQVHAIVHGVFHDQPLIRADLDRDRVEELVRRDRKAERGEPVREPRRLAMHALGDGLQTFRSMEHRIHRGDDGGQNLRRADIGGRALAPDMLFARLQSKAIGAIAARIDRHANKSARQRALIGVLDRHIAGVRAAIADGHAKTLHGAHGDVGAHLARRLQQA